MKTSELLKKLKKTGCRLIRRGSSHDIWYPITGKQFAVPRHKAEAKGGTARNIM